ncbi:MAG: KAP family P-loop NTPase fold protein [Acidimicrobiales bacterium]
MTLWDDNPSAVDLLGFGAVVAPVLQAIGAPQLDPVTIGIHAPWGGGKSTILGLIGGALREDARYLVVRTDPWEYDDHGDVKGTVIAEVLGALEARFGETAGLKEKTKGLLKRISWARVGIALANGALTMQWDPDALVSAFTPRAKETPDSITGFRDEFAGLLASLSDLDRVVVLVDDLDRCLPEAVTATLEAIKLFLSVPKMIFVIAADQDMVRDAIAVSVDSASRGDRFAARYLEKIIQLPVSLPRLAPYEAEAYTALLLARADCADSAHYDALVEHCGKRRMAHQVPLLGDLAGLPWQPDSGVLLMAAQFAQGLGADKVSNPREIKRFLNAFGIRRQIAEARGIQISPDVIGKLLLLEDRFRDDFDALAATPEAQRGDLLAAWEGWALEAEDKPRPERISESTKVWAASEPHLAAVELGPYITLAATLISSSLGAELSDELAALVGRLIGPSVADRGLAQEALAKRPMSDRRLAVNGLLRRARRVDNVTDTIEALISIAQSSGDLAEEIAAGIRQDCWRRIDPGSVAGLAGSEVANLVALVQDVANDDGLEADVRQAARQVMQA